MPGTFNPVTIAHVALAEAALAHVDEVLFVLPGQLPHKEFSGASFDERMRMLQAAVADAERFAVAASETGLFREIAGECRRQYGDEVRLSFICGRDAAERIERWDYGRPEAFGEMLREFDLLVAARGGEYHPPPGFEGSIRVMELHGDFEQVSASEVRRRIARGERWEDLAPRAIAHEVRRIYGAK